MNFGVAISSYKSDDSTISLIKKIIYEKWPINNLIIDNFPNSYLLYCGNATHSKRKFY